MLARVMGSNPKHCDLVAYQKFMKKVHKDKYKQNRKLRVNNRRRWRLMIKVYDMHLQRNYYKIVEEQIEYDY